MGEWKSREVLTRTDGLWLADGTDVPPIDTKVIVLAKGAAGLGLTGDRNTLRDLLGLGAPTATTDVVISAQWSSADGVDVHISSALVSSVEADKLAKELTAEDPFQAWLPEGQEDDQDQFSERSRGKTWIVHPSTIIRLDGHDPLGADSAVHRPRFSSAIVKSQSLRQVDPFGRAWAGADDKIVARSQAWRIKSYRSEGVHSGVRLTCTPEFLKRVLTSQHSELLLLLVLRRHEGGYRDAGGKYFHTTAVVHVDEALQVTFPRSYQ